MKTLLFSTCVADADRLEKLERMLASVARAVSCLPEGCDLQLHLLLQRCPDGAVPPLSGRHLVVSTMTTVVSLSAARNLLLREARSHGAFDAETLVAFPDDDCWYPTGVLEAIVAAFAADPTLDFWFCRYGSAPLDAAQADLAAVRPANFSTVVRNASSNTIFLRGPVMEAVGIFDERLGVGTPAGGSEDLDVAVRALQLSRRAVYRDAPVIGHRDKSDSVRERYFRSAMLVLARNATRGTGFEFLRKCVVGIYLLVRGKLSIATYAAALREAGLSFLARAEDPSCAA